jgi:hypothetical protein
MAVWGDDAGGLVVVVAGSVEVAVEGGKVRASHFDADPVTDVEVVAGIYRHRVFSRLLGTASVTVAPQD